MSIVNFAAQRYAEHSMQDICTYQTYRNARLGLKCVKLCELSRGGGKFPLLIKNGFTLTSGEVVRAVAKEAVACMCVLYLFRNTVAEILRQSESML